MPRYGNHEVTTQVTGLESPPSAELLMRTTLDQWREAE
jgi:hypothetical protein